MKHLEGSGEMNKFDRMRLQTTMKLAEPKPDDRVLDVGCGMGKWLLQIYPFKYYTPLDIGLGHNLEKGLPKVAYDNAPYDIIFLSAILEHLENFKTLLIECKGLLSKKGRIVINTPSNLRIMRSENPEHIHCFSPLNMRNLAKIIGMRIDKWGGISYAYLS